MSTEIYGGVVPPEYAPGYRICIFCIAQVRPKYYRW